MNYVFVNMTSALLVVVRVFSSKSRRWDVVDGCLSTGRNVWGRHLKGETEQTNKSTTNFRFGLVKYHTSPKY